ncbi:MAG: substrate-binding domain-containing protein, partial [Candidatus Omnitrophica bacterium]|nr:substrate-binding domain-containing protein [Candidatus Omnitrophota bacterium]
MRKGFIKILALSALFLAVSAFKAQGNIKIAVTTSIENTGLLDVLLPVFKERYGIEIHVIAAGSGRSLKLAENGDVDLVLVHYPKIEKEFIKQGFGIDRKSVFYNYFVVVGPKADPAGIKNSRTANDAFRKLVAGGVIFISRGDNSGTHGKEMEIWDTINFSPRGQWYIETGQGMG